MKKLLVTISVLILLFSCSQNKTKPITEVSQNELKNGILVDVRTPEEYRAGHIEGALNVNWFADEFLREIDALPKGQRLYLYCKKGGRSAKAAHILDSIGYDVINLSGGYDAWLQSQKGTN